MNYIIRERKFYRRMLSLALPVTCQMLINVGINIMDTLMLSKLGEAQIAASSLAGQFINLFYIVCLGIGGGSAVMTAMYWGHRDMTSFKKVLTLMLRISLIIACGFTLATALSPRGIFRLYTDGEAIIREGLRYFKWMAYSFVFQAITAPLSAVLRTARKTLIPLIASLCAFFLNIFVNWVFIFGNLGAPRLEIEGSAIGTITSYAVQAIIVSIYVFVIDKDIRYRVRDLFRPCIDKLREFIKFAAPVILSDTLLGLGMNGISVIGGHIGESFVAASAITSVVQRLATVYGQGIYTAGSVIVGNTLGENDPERAQREAVSSFLVSAGMGVFASIVILLISGPFISFYDITDETRAIARQLMYATSINVVFHLTGGMLTKGVLRGGGDTRFLLVTDIIFLWLVSLPLAALAGLVWHLPAFWVYIFMKIEMAIKTIIGIFRLFSKKWIHIVRFEDDPQKQKA
ncbi:MAG: MATE family efflux transporter [Oscillospiraceae bacterium]|nr:MATE family efflux transporter [Oscillospiraceae bacterium]